MNPHPSVDFYDVPPAVMKANEKIIFIAQDLKTVRVFDLTHFPPLSGPIYYCKITTASLFPFVIPSGVWFVKTMQNDN